MTELENYKFKKSQEVLNKPDIGEVGSFILGFDEADPIGFMEWVWGKSFYFFDRTDDKWRNTTMSAEHTFTTEQVYLKFLEYKQTLKP